MDIKDVLLNVGMLFLVVEPETNCWLFEVNTPGAVLETKSCFANPASYLWACHIGNSYPDSYTEKRAI
jgi:hypothetical protein